MTHPVLAGGRVAVVTGAASGIGLAAARRFASFGMKICLVDVDEVELGRACEGVAEITADGARDVLASVADVGDIDAVRKLKDAVYQRFGEVGLLMNNAVTRVGGGTSENHDQWQRAINVNLFGVINGVQTFVPQMISQGTPCVVVNTGSKQGITNPLGNAAYNVGKAAVKAYTEALQYELRNIQGCQVSAHLLVPGWTTTAKRVHKPGAWLPEQVVDILLEALERGDFYIICPDGEVTPEMDRARILWAAGDIVENRPPLSRWHFRYKQDFERFCTEESKE